MTTITTQVIDPFHIATEGIYSSNPLTIAINGFIVYITEEIIDVIPPVGGGGGASAVIFPSTQKVTKKRKKRITATVIIDGVEYTETVELDDLTITAKDIMVEVTTTQKPKLTLTVMRGNHGKV